MSGVSVAGSLGVKLISDWIYTYVRNAPELSGRNPLNVKSRRVKMIRLIAIGGVPGSGKSTLVRQLIQHWECSKFHKYGTLRFHTRAEHDDPVILGDYSDPGEMFPGTDRLSMAVITDALDYVMKLKTDKQETINVIFEGDRLFCNRFLDEAEADEKLIFVLWPSSAILEQRMSKRANTYKQKSSFLTGRKTKIMNMIEGRDDVQTIRFDTEADLERLMKRINDLIIPF